MNIPNFEGLADQLFDRLFVLCEFHQKGIENFEITITFELRLKLLIDDE